MGMGYWIEFLDWAINKHLVGSVGCNHCDFKIPIVQLDTQEWLNMIESLRSNIQIGGV